MAAGSWRMGNAGNDLRIRFFGFVIGLPVGVLLYVTRPGQIIANAKLYRTVSAIVNIFRSIPFIILLVWMIPFTRVIVGTSIGLQAAIVPLTVGAAPFIARMVETLCWRSQPG